MPTVKKYACGSESEDLKNIFWEGPCPISGLLELLDSIPPREVPSPAIFGIYESNAGSEVLYRWNEAEVRWEKV